MNLEVQGGRKERKRRRRRRRENRRGTKCIECLRKLYKASRVENHGTLNIQDTVLELIRKTE